MDAASCALLPSDCTLCGFPLPLLLPVPICDACWAEIPVHTEPVCSRCGDALPPVDSASRVCRPCRLVPPPFVRAVSYGPYQGRMRDAIHALKYQALVPASRRLGRMLSKAIAELAPDLPAKMLVIPVPLHRSKFSQRGFNQARLLASHALAGLRETHPGWRLTLASSTVVRQRATDSQAGLTPRQRRQNVRGAFVIPDPQAVTGQNVILVDDILTTGATVRSVAQVLLRAGAAKVWVATLSRARLGLGDVGNSGLVYSERERREEHPAVCSDPEQALNREMEDNQPSF